MLQRMYTNLVARYTHNIFNGKKQKVYSFKNVRTQLSNKQKQFNYPTIIVCEKFPHFHNHLGPHTENFLHV